MYPVFAMGMMEMIQVYIEVGMLMHGINKEAHSAPNRTLIVIIYNTAARMQPEFYIPI